MPLNFVQLNESHTSEYLACLVKYIVEKFGLENRIPNLVVKAILQRFRPPKKQTSSAPDDNDGDSNDKKAHHLISNDSASEFKSKEDLVGQPKGHNGKLEAKEELTLDDIHNLEEEDDEDIYTTFCAIATKLRKSPNSKAKFVNVCGETKCNMPHNIECDVPTRWNSTYKQMEQTLSLSNGLLFRIDKS
ncbi:hypothetical protein H4Q26_010157 [Puccinia striiformis f. sp. tritici PST-130]|nr:hypothetical protein H4Q26_010157 [Puccinia striiformis f. sp. tritici PST-130]